MKQVIAGKIEASYTRLNEPLDRNFNSEWLPSYAELRAELIAQYTKFKLWKGNGTPTVPLMMVNGNQPGLFNKEVQCWACGSEGHKVGAQECRANVGDIHPCAPGFYKQKMKSRGSGSSSYGGISGGNGTRLCKDYSTGSGYRKWGDNCRFSHEGTNGGSHGHDRGHGRGGSRPNKSGRGGGGKGMSHRQVTTMVLKNLKRIADSKGGDEQKGNSKRASG